MPRKEAFSGATFKESISQSSYPANSHFLLQRRETRGLQEWTLSILILTGSWPWHAWGCHYVLNESYQISYWNLTFHVVTLASEPSEMCLNEEPFVFLHEIGGLSQREAGGPSPSITPDTAIKGLLGKRSSFLPDSKPTGLWIYTPWASRTEIPFYYLEGTRLWYFIASRIHCGLILVSSSILRDDLFMV